MDSCVTMVLVVFVTGAVLLALLLVLLALPKSRLRSLLLEVGGWSTTGMSTVLLVSPLDLLPMLPLEDPLYLISAIGGAITAIVAHRQRQVLPERVGSGQVS